MKIVARELREKEEAQMVEEEVQGTEEETQGTEGEVKRVQEELQVLLGSKKAPDASNPQDIVYHHHDERGEDSIQASRDLRTALRLREKYMRGSFQSFPYVTSRYISDSDVPPTPDMFDVSNGYTYDAEPPIIKEPWNVEFPPDLLDHRLQFSGGVMHVYRSQSDLESGEHIKYPFIPIREFVEDTISLLKMITDGPLKSYCFRRLSYLSSKFNLYVLLNEIRELAAQKAVRHRDFYNVRKVDTHVHAASCMNQKHLLRFIKKTLKNNAQDEVYEDPNGSKMTLEDVFKSLKLSAYDLSVDTLDVHAVCSLFIVVSFCLKHD